MHWVNKRLVVLSAFILVFLFLFPANLLALTISPSSVNVTVLSGTTMIVSGSTQITVSDPNGFYFFWQGSDAPWITVPNVVPGPDTMWMYYCGPYSNYSCTYLVSLNTSGLAVGTHTGIAHSSVGNIPVTVTVRPAEFGVSPESLSLSVPKGYNANIATLTVTNNDSQTLVICVADDQTWMTTPGGSIGSANPGAGITTNVGFNAAALDSGSYTGSITVTYAGTTKTVPVALTVRPANFSFSPEAITISVPQGYNASPVTLTITNTEPQILTFSASDDQTWITGTGGSIGSANPDDKPLTPISRSFAFPLSEWHRRHFSAGPVDSWGFPLARGTRERILLPSSCLEAPAVHCRAASLPWHARQSAIPWCMLLKTDHPAFLVWG